MLAEEAVAALTQKKKVFLVRETFVWEYHDQPPAPKTPAVWAFPTREQAIACRDQLTKTCRHVNPFSDLGQTLQQLTSNEKRLRELIRSLGMKPPGRDGWSLWWYKNVEVLTDEQLAELWTALDKAVPYDLEEREVDTEIENEVRSTEPSPTPKRAAYVVQQLCWQYNDNWNDLGNDEPIKAFLDPELAELHRLELEEPIREIRRNPCGFAGGLNLSSSLTEEQLLTRLTEWGIELPPFLTNWNDETFRHFEDDAWWNRLWDRLPRRLFHQVWDLFDKVRFYEVVQIDVEG